MKVQNMTSNSSGREVANQFIITDNDTEYFQSYSTIIVKKELNKTLTPHQKNQPFMFNITLDKNKWDYSKTTGKYRDQFLGETKKETERKIASGEYKLADLNK